MRTDQQHKVKAFTENEELFDIVKEFIADLPLPERDNLSLQDYGALIVAHQNAKTAIKKRFDSLVYIGNSVK